MSAPMRAENHRDVDRIVALFPVLKNIEIILLSFRLCTRWLVFIMFFIDHRGIAKHLCDNGRFRSS
jgi:hypothetical protein